MKTRLCLTLCIFIFATLAMSLYAQSNDFIDSYFAKSKAGFGETTYLVLLAGGLITGASGVDDALAFLKTKNWGITIPAPDAAINLSDFSFLLMKTLDIQGGMMYALFPGPRYALRELVYKGVIIGNDTPGRTISGKEAFSILRKTIELTEAQK